VSEREPPRQLQVPTAVQRLPVVQDGPVRKPMKSAALWLGWCQAICKFPCRLVFSSQLMAKEPLQKLGFKDLLDPPSSQEHTDAKHWRAGPQTRVLLPAKRIQHSAVNETTTRALREQMEEKDCCECESEERTASRTECGRCRGTSFCGVGLNELSAT